MTKQKKLQTQIRDVTTRLASLEEQCYEEPSAASVRPAISQAHAALNATGFREYVERLEV